MENCAFSEYFTDCIARELLKDPGKDITTLDLDFKLSTLTLIWVGFLGVCFEVREGGGGKITLLSKTC